MSQPNRGGSDALDVLADTANNELRRSTSGGGNDSGSDSNREGTSPQTRPSLAKKDGLRKGKWLEEEEEYTSRVIHHFGSGIFVLPEGKTLRAFLADKLQCDPMRITKKFAGAACLSKKIHSLSGRSEFTPREIETARLEIKLLEERFLMRLERGPHAVLPPIKTPVVTTTSSPPLRQSSNATTVSGDALTDSTSNQGLASLALLAYNAQLAAASKSTAALTFAPPNNNTTIQQAVPAAAPPFAAIPQTQVQATLNLQAAVQSHPQATDVNQQLTQTLVSQLLTQLQSLSPNSLSQLHNQLFLGTTTSPPLAQNSALVTNNILQSLQNIQQGASQGQANIFQEAANGSRQPAVMPYITPRPAITTHHHPTFAGTQQQGNSKSLNNPAAGFLAELQRGHDAAVRQVLIRREAKKRKKRFAMSTQSSISLESSLSIVSSTSGARSKNQSDNDNEVSSSSTDLPTSDSPTKGCESSSSSDEEKDIRRVPLRKRFKASRNSGMTYRALQDHDERMARNDKM